jgi:hypothetical protein
MKHAIALLVTAAALFTSCNNSGESATAKDESKKDETKVASASTETKMDYAYTIEHPDYWEIGPKENTKMVLASLKAWETGNVEDAMKDFGDSIDLRFDGYREKLSKDSAKAMFIKQRSMSKAMQITMDDFESVKSTDGKEQWVSMWYRQKWQDQKGVWDSIYQMDDLKIENGKIIVLDEKSRHFAKKKM